VVGDPLLCCIGHWIKRAIGCYRLWGARRHIRQLKERYAEILDVRDLPLTGPTDHQGMMRTNSDSNDSNSGARIRSPVSTNNTTSFSSDSKSPSLPVHQLNRSHPASSRSRKEDSFTPTISAPSTSTTSSSSPSSNSSTSSGSQNGSISSSGSTSSQEILTVSAGVTDQLLHAALPPPSHPPVDPFHPFGSGTAGGEPQPVSESFDMIGGVARPIARVGVNEQIDTRSVLHATQAISKEMKLDRALITLMNILLACSGMSDLMEGRDVSSLLRDNIFI
jgi:hypothetical protein